MGKTIKSYDTIYSYAIPDIESGLGIAIGLVKVNSIPNPDHNA